MLGQSGCTPFLGHCFWCVAASVRPVSWRLICESGNVFAVDAGFGLAAGRWMTGARALVGFGRAVMRGRGPPGRVLRPFPNPSAHPRSLVLADLAGAGLAETNASLRFT